MLTAPERIGSGHPCFAEGAPLAIAGRMVYFQYSRVRKKMTIYDLVDGVSQPSLWLREQLWAQWALLAVAASFSFLLLLLLARRRRKTMPGAALADRLSEGFFGGRLELAGAEQGYHGIGDLTTGGATRADMRRENWAHTAAQLESTDTSIRLLRREIIKCDQTEARLERELAGLKAANEQLRKRVAESKQMSERLTLRIAELTEAREQAPDQTPELERANRQESESGQTNQAPVVDEIQQKQCRKCKQQKALNEFHKNASSNDGLARWCKVCKTKAAKEYRQRCASAQRTSSQSSGICADAPMCVLHHRQADRLKRARRRRPRDGEQRRPRTSRFRSPLSTARLHCPKK